MVGGVVVILLLLLALSAGLIAHLVGHPPNEPYLDMTDDFGIPKGPSSSFWFGADGSGRDLFVRVSYGARTSLLVAFIATTISMTVGTTVGIIAGYYRGFTDTVLSRTSDVVLALPQLLLAIGIAASCGTTAAGCAGGLIQPGLFLVIWPVTRACRRRRLGADISCRSLALRSARSGVCGGGHGECARPRSRATRSPCRRGRALRG